MFREIRRREVERNIELEKLNKNQEEGFKQIKPKTNMTFEEAENFWDEYFMSMGE